MKRITYWRFPSYIVNNTQYGRFTRWDYFLQKQVERMGADNCIIVSKISDFDNYLSIYIKEEWDDYYSRLGQDGEGR